MGRNGLSSFVVGDPGVGWTSEIYERSGFHSEAASRLLTSSSLNISGNAVPFFIDLKDLNYPVTYDLVFAVSNYETIGAPQDYTTWIRVPPPKLSISFSDNPVNLRPGGTSTINILLNSSLGLEPQGTDSFRGSRFFKNRQY